MLYAPAPIVLRVHMRVPAVEVALIRLLYLVERCHPRLSSPVSYPLLASHLLPLLALFAHPQDKNPPFRSLSMSRLLSHGYAKEAIGKLPEKCSNYTDAVEPLTSSRISGFCPL